jgi:magnesium chelatase family protein
MMGTKLRAFAPLCNRSLEDLVRAINFYRHLEVEVDIAQSGLPNFLIVGLPDAAVQEARERVRAAIRNSGLAFPMRRITVNLAPADLKKEGPSYDLPIAVGILLASGQLDADASGVLYLGELSLDGA